MAVGKKITELNKEVKSNLSNDGTLVYVVNNKVSKQVDLDNLLFDGIITSNKIAANAITAREVTASVLQINGDRIDNLSTSLGNVSTSLSDAITNITSITSTLNGLEDGGINTFYQSTAPTGVIGDLWFNTTTNKLSRWDGSDWITIEDAGITTAIQNAAAAANVADNKITTYYNDNAPTTDLIDGDALDALDTGDLWFDTNDNNKLYRWSGTEWQSVQDGQIDTLSTSLGNAITNITSITSTLNGLEDGGINTFYQDSEPTGTIGDLWFNTTTNKLTRYNGSTWNTIEDAGITTAISDAASAANVADNKITTYYNDEPPTLDLIDGDALDALDTGDLWFDTNDSNKLYRWSGTEWVSVQDLEVQTNIYSTGTTTINGGIITTNTISADQIAANTITATQIAACSITATKIAACSIGATQIQAGAITAQAIASNIVITGSIQSRNFDGFNVVDSTGEEILQYLDAGENGFFLDERTGTAVFTDIIARDNVIAANYIKYNANSGLSAIDADGNFGINLDNETLQIEDGRVKIKQIPSNSVIDESLYLNNNTVFFGQEATEVFALPPMKTWIDPNENINEDNIFNANYYYGGDVRDGIKVETLPGIYPSSSIEPLLLHIDLFDYVDSADQINGIISLNNVKFYIDFTNYASINYIDSFTFATRAVVTSTLGDTDSYTTTDSYFRNTVSNPTMLPRVYEIVADITCGSIKVNNNSRYLSIYLNNHINVPNSSTDQDNPVTQYIGLSAEFNTDTNFRFDVYGAVPEDRIHSLSEITRLAPGHQLGAGKVNGYSESWNVVNAEWSSADYIMNGSFYGPYTPLSWTPYV
tara:strand:- start:8584 stop:11052 length:2469 start_codon:yes stop_codon:yes gene_type:complete